jgi:hypothetical protein
MSAAAQRHSIARRQIVSRLDADLVASRVAEAVSDIRYRVLPQRNPNVFEVLGHVASVDSWLLLPLKFVPAVKAASRSDEWWLRTCHPYGERRFSKATRQGLLVKIDI